MSIAFPIGYLVRAYERHGCRLANHDAEAAARALVIEVASVHRHLNRHFDSLETSWSLAAALQARATSRIRTAQDALAAYEHLVALGLAPPTFRMFRLLFIDSGGFPELNPLVARDRLVWDMARNGQGPRACHECAAERR